MPPSEDNLSPEEKLLKVIQGGGSQQEEEDPAAETTASAPDLNETLDAAPADDVQAVPGTSPEPEAAKPKLRLAGGGGKVVPIAPAATAAAVKQTAPESGRPSVAVARKQKRGGGYGIMTANRVLGVVVVLLLLLIGLEIWMQIRMRAAHWPHVPGGGVVEAGVQEGEKPQIELPPLASMLAPFETRSLFFGELGPGPGPKPPVPVTLEQTVAFIGVSTAPGVASGVEAILMDKKADKMHFLTVGDTVTIDERSMTLEEILSDRVVLSEGGKRFELK